MPVLNLERLSSICCRLEEARGTRKRIANRQHARHINQEAKQETLSIKRQARIKDTPRWRLIPMPSTTRARSHFLSVRRAIALLEATSHRLSTACSLADCCLAPKPSMQLTTSSGGESSDTGNISTRQVTANAASLSDFKQTLTRIHLLLRLNNQDQQLQIVKHFGKGFSMAERPAAQRITVHKYGVHAGSEYAESRHLKENQEFSARSNLNKNQSTRRRFSTTGNQLEQQAQFRSWNDLLDSRRPGKFFLPEHRRAWAAKKEAGERLVQRETWPGAWRTRKDRVQIDKDGICGSEQDLESWLQRGREERRLKG